MKDGTHLYVTYTVCWREGRGEIEMEIELEKEGKRREGMGRVFK